MDIRFLFPTIATLLLGAPQSNWMPFHSPKGNFTVTEPGVPQERVRTINTPYGPCQLHEYVASPDGGHTDYYIAYSTLPAPASRRPANVTLAGTVHGATKALGGQLLGCRPCSQQGFPGCEYTVAAPGGALFFSHAFIAKGRLYQVNFMAAGATTITREAARFMRSFKLTTKRT